MTFNFPNTPAPGDLYAPAGGPSWRFLDGAWQSVEVLGGIEDAPSDGQLYGRQDTAWVEVPETPAPPTIPDEVVGGIVTISSTAPGSPATGDVWIDTT